MAGKIADAVLTYALIKRLVTPFDKWPAYKKGIIDADGTVLKPRKTLEPFDKEAWGRFDILAANIKKLIQKLPGGSSHLASMAAAAYLFKEGLDISNKQTFERSLFNYLKEDGTGVANVVGNGKVAGLGVGPQGEPPMGRNAQLKRLRKALKRT